MALKDYTIITEADLTQAKVDVCLQGALATVRRSNDGRCVLKWPIEIGAPSELGSVTVYSRAQILVEMAKPEWIEAV